MRALFPVGYEDRPRLTAVLDLSAPHRSTARNSSQDSRCDPNPSPFLQTLLMVVLLILQAGAGNVDNRLKDLTALVETQAHHLNLLSNFLVPHGFPGLKSPLVVKDESHSPQEHQLDLGESAGAGVMDPPSTSSGGMYSSMGLSTRSRDGDGQEPVEMMSVGSSSTATNSALLPPPHPLYTLGLTSQQQQQQQQHPFASPHTAAETLLGLSGSSFISGSQAEFGGGGASMGAGPSRLRQEDVLVSENGNVYVSLQPLL